ncbi:MAG: peptidylprolyl isomerase [Bacteroidetes bacterium]|nr:peptidylprolyl isomerase [Bacteroidota bacterium]MDA0889407.1 peptidylprolyl isomerase [Bacteroidota bacterium]MDA1085283.1 peptidylprolyl isomerase [Bacteroidota bacterium]
MNKFPTLFCLLIGFFVFAQSQDPTKTRLKIDGISAVVGDYVILESDIDKAYIDLESQGVSTSDITRCSLLGKLMEDKLYAHHAEQDSIEVSNDDINNYVEQTIDYFVQQIGSMDKVLEFYKKKDEQSFRAELFEVNRVQQLSQRMQSKIVEDVEVTPDEVKAFFNAIPKEDLPIFGSELEVAQIVIEPDVSADEEKRIIEQLETMRNDVLENGSSFGSKAILYSQDPGSRSRGGRYTLDRKRPQMVKEFREQAYRLQEGEISQPFKTDFGWHIVTVDKIRGRQIDVRHILLTPTVSNIALGEAQNELKLIKKRIEDGEITFADAAREFSDDQITRANGGVLINPSTGDTRFELTKLDPQLYNQILKLEDNEISIPILEEDRSGNKKYKIVMVTNLFNEHVADYVQDYVRIKDLALKEKQLKSIEKWMTEKISDTYVSVNRNSQSCDFANNWLKK